MPDGDACTPDETKLFDYSDALLKKTYDRYLDANYRVVGISLLVIGWLITSESARTTLKGNPLFWWIAVVTALGGAAIYLVTHLRLYAISQTLASELARQRRRLKQRYDCSIRWQLAVSATSVNVLLFAAVFVLLLHL